MCQGRRQKAQKINSADREAWLRKKGYSIECFKRVAREIKEIKASRRQSRGKPVSNAEPTKELDLIEGYRLLAHAALRPGRSIASNVDCSQGVEKKSSRGGSKVDSSQGAEQKASRASQTDSSRRLEKKSSCGGSKVDSSQGAEKKCSQEGRPLLQRISSCRLSL
jgi:hypothetical protein